MRFKKSITFILAISILIIFIACIPSGCSHKKTPKARKNVIVILIDALRRDRLGIYGYHRNTSPNIDRLAKQSLIIENAVSQSGWTAPSIQALFSSEYPKADLKDRSTFAQWLSKNNYQTAAFATNPILISSMGYDKGFQTYHKEDWASARTVVNWTLDWLQNREQEKPFYLYLHFMDVHDPYHPPNRFVKKFCSPYDGTVDGDVVPYKEKMRSKEALGLSERDIQHLNDLYDAGIAYVDFQLARVLEGLKKSGLYENTVIVFASDHGDEFMEHDGIGHGHTVYDELIRVPLFIHGVENLNGKHYAGLFELIDLAPTVSELLGIPYDYKVTGKSFASYFATNRPLKHVTFSEVHRTVGLRAGCWNVCARMSNKKAMFYPHTNRYQFYNLQQDPRERNPQEAFQGNVTQTLKDLLQQWRKVFGSTGKREQYDPEAMKALRSLGYL